MNQIGTRFKVYMICFVLSLIIAISCISKAHADQKSVGIFQFIANSMGVVGIENDVTYVVRNELRKTSNLSLLNQREMEVTLMRNDVIQNFNVNDAVRAGQILNVDYIIIGKISRSGEGIVSDISLISVIAKHAINNWSFTFSNQQDVRNNAVMIGSALIEGINGDLGFASSNEPLSAEWLSAFNAKASNGLITIDWQLIDHDIEILGFNLYKSLSSEGPFSYVSSVLEFSYEEAIGDTAGDVFYQLSVINGEGEEIRSENIIKVTVQAAHKSTIAAPAIVKTTAFIRGFEIFFVPSATNTKANITEYQLLRKSQDLPWIVIKRAIVEGSDLNKNTSENVKQRVTDNIQRYTLSDNTAKKNVSYDYAIRAVNNVGELGAISDIYSYQADNSPQLIDTKNLVARSIILQWVPVSIGSGYVLYRRIGGATDWKKLISIPNIATSVYTDNDIQQDGQMFEYSIAVFDSNTETEKSQPIRLVSKPPLLAPEAFRAISGLPRQVKLSWRPYVDNDLKGYAIYRAPFTEDTNISLLKIAEVLEPKADSYIDKTTNVDGAAYYYAVASINVYDSFGELTPVKRGTTKNPPQRPEYLTSLVEDSMITLSWGQGDLSAVDRFIIQRRWQQQEWHNVATVFNNVFSFSDTELLPQARVEYRIQAIDSDGIPSQPVMSGEHRTLNQLFFIKQDDSLLRAVNLEWSGMDFIEKIEVLRRTNNQNWRLINTLDGRANSYKDTVDLLDDTEYEYYLKIYLGGTVITSSDIISMNTKDIAAPNSVTASSDKPREIIINWQPNLDESIKSVMLYRASPVDNYLQHVFISELEANKAPQFVDTTASGSIEHGLTYSYKVASKNVFDVVGPQSRGVTGSSKKLPDSPTDLDISASKTSITLSWQTNDKQDLDKVVVFRKWQNQVEWVKIADMSAEITFYEDKALLPFANAAYKLLLTDLDGLSSVESQVIEQASPVAVNLTAKNQNLLRAADLQWSTNEYVDSYEIIRSIDKVNWSKTGTTSSHSYKDTKDLTDQTQYFYRVLPIQAASRLGESQIVSVATKDLPLPPTKITATSGLVQEVVLNWELADDKDVGGYIISRIEIDGSLERLDKLNSTANSYSDKGGFFSKLEHGTQYEYVLTSYNVHEAQGNTSNIIAAKTKAVPKQVMGLSVKSINGQIILDWLKNTETDIESYQVFRGKSCSRTQKISTLSANLTGFTDIKVDPGKQYCYQVLAVCKDSLIGNKSTGEIISLPEIVTTL
jgi:fibronectin type 3 domain-containing protein